MKIKCVTACTNLSGESDFDHCVVTCTKDQYLLGEHYDKAISHAEREGYEGPYVVFEERESSGKALLKLFNWKCAETVK